MLAIDKMCMGELAMKNENKLRQEKERALDKATDILMDTKDIIKTGFGILDNQWTWSSLGKGEVRLLGARPGVGKTILALSIAEFNAIRMNIPVFYITIQSPPFVLMMRLLELMSGVKGSRDLVDDDATRLFNEAYSRVKDAPLYFRQHEYPTMKGITDEMCLCSAPPQLVIVDEIGTMTMSRREAMRVTKEMRKLAEYTGAAVLILSNVARQVDLRDDHMPVLADLPVDAQMVDSILMMYRDGYYNGPPSEDLMDDEEPVYDDAHLVIHDCNLRRNIGVDMEFSWEESCFVR